jgi:hypothetical protein
LPRSPETSRRREGASGRESGVTGEGSIDSHRPGAARRQRPTAATSAGSPSRSCRGMPKPATEPGASFGRFGNLLGMATTSYRTERTLTRIEFVRCLACSSEYSKPVGGGTTAANPGCPECGYLGWQPVMGRRERPRHRFSVGPLQRRMA